MTRLLLDLFILSSPNSSQSSQQSPLVVIWDFGVIVLKVNILLLAMIQFFYERQPSPEPSEFSARVLEELNFLTLFQNSSFFCKGSVFIHTPRSFKKLMTNSSLWKLWNSLLSGFKLSVRRAISNWSEPSSDQESQSMRARAGSDWIDGDLFCFNIFS